MVNTLPAREAMSQHTDPDAPPALSIRNLSKTFPGGKGLRGVDLNLAQGTVHALLGQNGCGKSTLIKSLAGVYQPDPGSTALVRGHAVELGSTRTAHEAGFRFIHQDLGLIGDLDVTDNLALGSHYGGNAWLSDKREHDRAQQLLDRYGIDIDARERLDRLAPAEQTLVAIARALSDDAIEGPRLIVLDEPTAALQADEVALLFRLIETLRREGNTMLYVTHRLDEVFAICDQVTVLRDGAVISSAQVSTLNHNSLVELILGEAVEGIEPGHPRPEAPVALEARALRGGCVRHADLALHRGEIVGITGLLGSGFDDVAFMLAGALERDGGEILLEGTPAKITDPNSAIRHGIGFAPADRKRLSAMQGWSLSENITLPMIPTGKCNWLSERREQREVLPWLDLLRVRFTPMALLSTLSGGNQQRVVLARWLRTRAKVLLLQEPTNGVDSGAKHAIYLAMREAADRDTTILFSSSDAEELAAVADRVLVMTDGVLNHEFRALHR